MSAGLASPPCGTGCGQLELFPADPAPAGEPEPPAEFDWDAHHFVVVGHSGGKDSAVTTDAVCTAADKAGALHKVRVLHCDLGRTPEGRSIEWPGAVDVARRQAAHYGVRFDVRRTKAWKSLFHRIMDHGDFPGFFARYCTAEGKTRVGRDFVDEVGVEMGLDCPPRAGYAMGMRAEESTARAKRPVIERHRMSGKGTVRVVTTWLPVHQLTTEQVWQIHRDKGLEVHPAYEKVERLSCQLCPLAKREQLVMTAHLNPGLAAEYASGEKRLGKPFKKNLSMQRIIELARAIHGRPER